MSQNKIKENFIMPGEWEKHFATWLVWPNDDDYFEHRIENIEKIYLKIIKALHKDEFIKLLVLDKKTEEKVRVMLESIDIDLSKIIFYHQEYVDVWIRDYGPTFVKNNNKKAWIKWNYDGYGGKFPELLKDGNIFFNLKNEIDGNMFKEEIALEGGAVDSNGDGIILTTEECLIQNRNKGKTKNDYQAIFKDTLGTEKIIWLNNGILNDHTDGHIDEVARFVGSNKILCAYEDDKNDENFERLDENFKILSEATDQYGNKFEIIKLPMPHMYYENGEKEHHGRKAPVSYANFYIGNKTVLVSLYNDKNDAKAMEIIKSCFPDREVVGIDCRDFIYGGGAIHCATQQEPF